MFAAANPAAHIKKNVPKEQQMQLLDLLTECTDKVRSYPGMCILCACSQLKRCTQSTRCTHPSSAWLWKRTKAGCASTKTLETSPQRCRSAKVTVRHPACCLAVTDCGADVSRVVAFIILNNLKHIIKTWRKQLGDETLYLQFQTAMSVI